MHIRFDYIDVGTFQLQRNFNFCLKLNHSFEYFWWILLISERLLIYLDDRKRLSTFGRVLRKAKLIAYRHSAVSHPF